MPLEKLKNKIGERLPNYDEDAIRTAAARIHEQNGDTPQAKRVQELAKLATANGLISPQQAHEAQDRALSPARDIGNLTPSAENIAVTQISIEQPIVVSNSEQLL